MAFFIAKDETAVSVMLDANEYSGVKKAAGWLAGDISLVTGKKPSVREISGKVPAVRRNTIVAGTVGRSSLVESVSAQAGISLDDIREKREVYRIFIYRNMLVVAGSDKRGTIYGLLRLSEAVGVSPMVFWGDTSPVRYCSIYVGSGKSTADCLVIREKDILGTSKEPSVKYRGFFINDEWPAFGNWSESHFGDENKKCYEKVFEYLLRLKGNYMWPAMWASVLWSDGPGLATAELADELGVVLGTSHHEPCIRAGEEFVRLNPTHGEYGKKWSFVTNRKGITKFWDDSLKEREKFENIITVGMRGERDSKLFEDAKLIDNINVLKDVINCQKELIAKYSPKGPEELPPMMLAIYKEVEEYYKGDAETAGLKEWDGLDGVTLMLCDDNFGNLRLMPDDDKRDHKGGYGMYYHFDYHGGPVSFEWINSSYLPKIWEQMTTCYDFGIREIWIVNVGDLKNQELPLSYFMDLAYDFDRYGTDRPGNYTEYLTKWINAQFRGLPAGKRAVLRELAEGYTRLNNIVKPEVMNAEVYSLERFAEAEHVLKLVEALEKKAVGLYSELEKKHTDYLNAYVSLIYYQAMETFNLVKMWIYSAKNRKYAMQGRVSANIYADRVRECLKKDSDLVDLFHKIDGGRWYGMGLSRHIGFANWNDEGARKPVMIYVEPQQGAELVLADSDSSVWSVGGPWNRKPVCLAGFSYKNFGGFEICSAGSVPIEYSIDCSDPDIEFLSDPADVERLMADENAFDACCASKEADNAFEKLNWTKNVSGITETDKRIYVRCLKKSALRHEFTVKTNNGDVTVYFGGDKDEDRKHTYRKATIIPAGGYSKLTATAEGSYLEISEFGRLLPGECGSALKAYPQDIRFADGPVAEYCVNVEKEGDYLITVETAPSNPAFTDSLISADISVNNGEYYRASTVSESFRGGETSCREWCIGVLVNMRAVTVEAQLKKGKNTIKIRAVDPCFVLERIIIEAK